MQTHLYPLNSGSSPYIRQLVLKDKHLSDCVYANIVVDIQARELKDKLFTYRIPEALTGETFIGAQVLVPFGSNNLIGGFVVSLTDKPSSPESAIKDIAEVIEPEPLFDREYIDLLYWVAEFYCASISDAIAAAIPSFFSPKIKRYVKLTERGSATAAGATLSKTREPAMFHLLNMLAESKGGSLSVVALRQRWRKAARLPQSQFYRAQNYLRQEGFITIETQTSEAATAKTRATVIWTGQEAPTSRLKEVIAVLVRHGGQMLLAQLIDEASTTHSSIKKLASEGVVVVSQEEVVRDPLRSTESKTETLPDLTEDQVKVLAVLSRELTARLAAARPVVSLGDSTAEREVSGSAVAALVRTSDEDCAPWLLHGVTGSGKTEIYLRLIDQALNGGRTALLLVPEISLTPQLAGRLKSRFADKVSVWHSALSDGERYDTWRRLRAGDVKVLLGARSAVLANIPDLGLIILDEEHDGSYKQSSPAPRYHARDVAIERARRTGALLVLGSATPDVGSFFAATQSGRILELPRRVFQQPMPEVRMVDMRQELAEGNRSIFSRVLLTRLADCLDAKEQAILLINRRGYASYVFCRACGFVLQCKNCSVSLVFHQSKAPASSHESLQNIYLGGHLACHHCGYHTASMEICPSCRSPFIRQFGLGTQRVEEEVAMRYPDARVLRLDSDVTARRGAHEEILKQFSRGEADVLIGTQMVSKGLDIPNVTLVGVLAADAAFNLPDYRSVERGFQLLTQVAGRAGRGDRPGSVVMQTFNPEMPALNWSKQHDYATFVQEELAARKTFDYPPFSQLLRVVVAGPDAYEVEAACEQLAEQLSNNLADALPESDIKVLGPAPCLLERLRGKFRFHLLIKNMVGERGRKLLTDFLRSRRLANGLVLAIDVDALDLL
ncbi:MAG TPA: primosomal protein N' [Planktothrix sp.]|jgi:primosomal protein N' (replication factor Y)